MTQYCGILSKMMVESIFKSEYNWNGVKHMLLFAINTIKYITETNLSSNIFKSSLVHINFASKNGLQRGVICMDFE